MPETSRDGGREDASSKCGLCSRGLLVGESVRVYRDPRDQRFVSVCELCRGRARARGFELLDRDEARPRLRVQASGSVGDLDAVEGGVDGGQPSSLERMRHRLGDDAVDEDAGTLTAAGIERMAERMRHLELELETLRREQDPARRAEERRELVARTGEARNLRRQLAEANERLERLQHARTAETSTLQMSRYALDAFNQSAHVERMARIARTLDAPVVNLHDEGPGIPRRIRVTLAFEIAWYEFVVKLDLAAGAASVHETGHGGDPSDLPRERRRANASWRDSGVVLS